MAKGYWIAFVTVTDPARYAGYQELAPAAFAAYGARFLARGGEATHLEGDVYARHVVIEFDSKAQALGLLSFRGLSGGAGPNATLPARRRSPSSRAFRPDR